MPMSAWTAEALDRKAANDVKRGEYDPPYSWMPFTWERQGTWERETYDGAYKYHRDYVKKRASR